MEERPHVRAVDALCLQNHSALKSSPYDGPMYPLLHPS